VGDVVVVVVVWATGVVVAGAVVVGASGVVDGAVVVVGATVVVVVVVVVVGATVVVVLVGATVVVVVVGAAGCVVAGVSGACADATAGMEAVAMAPSRTMPMRRRIRPAPDTLEPAVDASDGGRGVAGRMAVMSFRVCIGTSTPQVEHEKRKEPRRATETSSHGFMRTSPDRPCMDG